MTFHFVPDTSNANAQKAQEIAKLSRKELTPRSFNLTDGLPGKPPLSLPAADWIPSDQTDGKTHVSFVGYGETGGHPIFGVRHRLAHHLSSLFVYRQAWRTVRTLMLITIVRGSAYFMNDYLLSRNTCFDAIKGENRVEDFVLLSPMGNYEFPPY